MSEPTPTPEPNKGGRRPKLTPAVHEGIVTLVIKGNYLIPSARKMGVSKSSVMRWMAIGRKFPDGIYGTFRNAVRNAIAESETDLVSRINDAGSEDPRLLLALLERRHPARWGRERAQIAQLEKQVRELEALIDGPNPSQVTSEG